MSDSETTSHRSQLRQAGLTAAALMITNVLVYAFTLAASRSLAPASFGGVSALLGVLQVANVGALTLQTTFARRIATAAPDQRDAVMARARDNGTRISLALGLLALALAPLLAAALRVPLAAALLVAPTVFGLTSAGASCGILQGAQRWRPLSLTFLGIGLGRVACGITALLIEPSVTSALLGVALGTFVSTALGWYFTKGLADTRGTDQSLRELFANGHSLLAFFLLTNLDVLLARNQFADFDSGLYGAGSILVKTCLFLPQIVIVVVFPKIAQDQALDVNDRGWLRPLAVVAALGGVAVLACVVLADLAVWFVGGADYVAITPYVWVFALEGTLFAVLQMGVYRQIARQVNVAGIIWVAVALAVLGGLFVVDSVPQLAWLMIGVSLLILIPVTLRSPRPRQAQPRQTWPRKDRPRRARPS